MHLDGRILTDLLPKTALFLSFGPLSGCRAWTFEACVGS
jgi:hypothetical protein